MEAKFLDDNKPKTLGGGWGYSHMKGAGMLVESFELSGLKESKVAVAEPFFDH